MGIWRATIQPPIDGEVVPELCLTESDMLVDQSRGEGRCVTGFGGMMVLICLTCRNDIDLGMQGECVWKLGLCAWAGVGVIMLN